MLCLRYLTAAVLSLLVLAAAPGSRAALDLETGALPATGLEIVVIEAKGCIYCHLLRRDVWPAYERSGRGHEVPMRFLDINAREAEVLKLKDAIGLVPTVLLVRGTTEVGRITGYTGPESFFHAINHLISGAD